ncbi:uncharacterized protein N7496_012691 [Penicillium cataractarum]|uniref:NACHT domain-containing protein n=1 Tax=Penicillium cataractarum TaxID=2100454 RepID=A0A9W9UT04_9EURO|nr:uncharacterized protein N7496_012691 [Penicillium cataractarum]KAJ5355479.1 hypothetical protein N7496_012691 [Penicillium cataractarum]
MSLSDFERDTVLVGAGDVQGFNSDNILPLPVKELAKITKWLQPTSYNFEKSEYSRHSASHLLGTGTWLTSTQIYQQWHSDDNGLLWLKGIPGSGKSVMAASIIKQLQEANIPVVYFFFRQIIEANHKPIVALRDWLCQVLDYSPPLQVKLQNYVAKGRSLDSLSPDDLWSDLMMALHGFPKVYCVTDALDEMDRGNDEFLKRLVALGQWRPKNVKVLMTSRPIARLETSLRSFSIPQLRLEERFVDLDIAAYVQYKLCGSSIAKENWSAIQEAIPGRANGIFLYAKISMDVFLEPGADVQEVLNALPMDLNTMYDELLQEHARRSNVPPELQLIILQFVTHATRPLRLLEIAEMLSIHSEYNRTLKETKDLVRAACGPLLEVLPDETVSVIHHTFTEFLNGYTRSRPTNNFEYPIFEAGSTNLRLAMACLCYLRTGCLDNIEITKIIPMEDYRHFKDRREKKTRELRLQFPFLEYAANNWYKHAHRAEVSGVNLEMFHDALDALFADTLPYNVWLDLAWPGWGIDGITPLHVAAQTGLAQLAKHILSKRKIAEKESVALPIYWAASHNHGDVIQVLVDYGADPDVELSEGLKPLHLAAKLNHVDAVKALIAAGVSPLTPKTKEDNLPTGGCALPDTSTIGDTPLMYACHAGHLEAVVEFVPKLKAVEDMHRALYWAAEKGRSSIVELILQQPGVDVNVKLQGETALFVACKSSHLKTIEALIKSGADPNIICESINEDRSRRSSRASSPKEKSSSACERGYMALHALCKNKVWGKQASSQAAQSVKVLLQAGANVHAMDPIGSTALHYALKSSIAWIKPLLDAGADPAAENDNGETPLHSPSSLENEALSLLLESGKVDINKRRAKDGMTPLLCRLSRVTGYKFDDPKVIDFLAYMPDVNATDSKGDGPLHLALRRLCRDHELIDALLAAGTDPNLKNAVGNTPLHEMRNGVTQEIMKSLLLAGADLETRNNNGQSVLFAQLSPCKALRDKSKILGHLANEGARLDTRDYKGRTLWHCAIDSLDTLSLLQSLGVDPLVSDYDGNTPLHEVVTDKSLNRKRKVLERLIDMGMNINQRNHQGRTVLHIVCSRDDFVVNWDGDTVYMVLDYVLEQSSECLTVSDHKGIQPLHIAATISETFVLKILNAGADICAATHEKMTVLHLAARARQSGIIDIILSRAKSLAAQKRLDFVNSQDDDGRTALHYACRSGRPETVKSLLDAGAACDVLDIHGHSPLALCGEFEKEASLWDRRMPSARPPGTRPNRGLNAAGLTLKDDMRPFFDRAEDDTDPIFGRINSEHDTTRMAEIIDLLVKYGADLESDYGSLESAWKNSTHPEYGYTLSCLSPLRIQSPSPPIIRFGGHPTVEDFDRQLQISVAINCRNAIKDALEKRGEQEGENGKKWHVDHHLFSQQRSAENALALRYYDLFEDLSGGVDSLHVPDYHGHTSLNMLARWGFVEILDRLCTREIATQLDGVYWASNPDENDLHQCSIPLIMSACERQLPNMDVLKLIVEGFGVNVNSKRTKRITRDKGYYPSTTTGVLHELAVGKFWWHVDKALPYLIKMGANINIQNRKGETPLIVAINSSHPFSKEAYEALIVAGADVNAVDTAGNTCLSLAGDNMDIIKILIAHGAEVSPSAIVSALDLEKVELLEVLLSRSGSSILREPLPARISYSTRSAHFKTVGSGTLPLLYAAAYSAHSAGRSRLNSNITIRKQSVDILLKHGADPYATFHKKQYQVIDPWSSLTEEPREFPVTTATIIHELLGDGQIVDPFFNLPSLDTERRDENGCTLILAASKNDGSHVGPSDQILNSMDCFAELISRGADVMAQDNEGRTILHHIGRRIIVSSALRTAVTANPSLIHLADDANETALHYALRDKCPEMIQFLLDNGADLLQPDKNGDTALHHISKFFKLDQVLFERFIRAGVDINARNKIGETPIFDLLKQNNENVCGSAEDQIYKDSAFEFLLNSGADVFARRNDGSTLLHLLAGIKLEDPFGSKRSGDRRVGVRRFRRLMDMGLDPMTEDKRQRTSIDVAAACENELILKLFKREPMKWK